MRFLTDANFDLDDIAMAKLMTEMESFLRVGDFTLTEWQSLSAVEQQVAVEVRKRLKLEEALLLRAAALAMTPEDMAGLLQGIGDVRGAAKVLLREAVRGLARGMTNDEFVMATR